MIVCVCMYMCGIETGWPYRRINVTLRA